MKRKTTLVIGILLFICAGIALTLYHHKQKNAPIVAAPILVRIQHPIEKRLPETVSATGYLVANKSTTITPRVSGYIQAIQFHEGDNIKTNDVLFQLNAQGEKDALAAAIAANELSQLQYQRDQKLFKKGFITQESVYAAKVSAKQNQAALQTAQDKLAQRTMIAPFNGTLGAINVSLGDYVNPGTALTTLVDDNQLKVEYRVPITVLSHLQLNQPVTISDATRKNKITAKVSFISPSVDQNTQTIAVHAEINNVTQLFKAGEYVTITQDIGTHKNTLLIPDESLQAAVDGYFVFIVKNNKAVKLSVKIGKRIGGNVIIASGLTPTDNIIVAGQNQVSNHQAVAIQSTAQK